jgi:hypothetical protein
MTTPGGSDSGTERSHPEVSIAPDSDPSLAEASGPSAGEGDESGDSTEAPEGAGLVDTASDEPQGGAATPL